MGHGGNLCAEAVLGMGRKVLPTILSIYSWHEEEEAGACVWVLSITEWNTF